MTTPITRTRTGCWTCRSRRVKCDEIRPVCRGCTRNKLSCEYSVRLIWQEESFSRTGYGRINSQSASKGISRGKPRSQQKKPDSLSREPAQAMFLNTTIRDLEFYFQFEQPMHEQKSRQHHDDHIPHYLMRAIPPSIGGSSPSSFQTLDYDPALLSYYDAVICSSSTLLDDAYHNPYRHLILPLALTCEGLYHATLAVAAQKLCLAEPNYRFAALSHGQRAMRRLIQILDKGVPIGADSDELFGLSLMLCCYEISNDSRPSWITHLDGICTIVSQFRQPSSSVSGQTSQLHRFFTQYCAYHFVFARTIFSFDNDHCRTSSAPTIAHPSADVIPPDTGLSTIPGLVSDGQSPSLCESSNFLAHSMPLEELDEINPVTGFSNSLLLLINEIADFAAQRDLPSPTSPQRELFEGRLVWLQTSLESLQQTVPLNLAASSNLAAVEEFTATAEVNRLGALLFLYAVCRDKLKLRSLYHSPHTGGSQDDGMDSEATNQVLVSRILSTIGQRLDRMVRTAAMPLWPLFLAGCYATTDEDRVAVLHIFRECEQLKRFGNVKPARRVIETVWRQRDLGVQDDRKRRRAAAEYCSPGDFHDQNSPRKFIWEQAMDMLGGWRLSLT